MTVATDPLGLLRVGLSQAATMVAQTKPEQLEHPTPCTEWDVQTLLRHMVGGLRRFRDTMLGAKVEWGVESGALVQNDWGATYRDGVDQLLAAWQADGALERSYPFMGTETPAGMLINFQMTEVALHSWDLARATGRVHELDDRVATAALTMLRGVLTPEMRGTAFGPERVPGDDASAYARLAAFSGREVEAQPT